MHGQSHECIKRRPIFVIYIYIQCLSFLFEMKDFKKSACLINCDAERMRGSCLRNEHNKGINYCRHHRAGMTLLCVLGFHGNRNGKVNVS